jgi:Tol biopolymer transport system component
MKKTILVVIILGAVLALFGGSLMAAGGSGPDDALLPVGVPQTVAAHSTQWYRFDYGGRNTEIDATLDDQGASGIRFEIYTPDEIGAWEKGNGLNSIGAGSPMQGHDLGWVGRFNFAGRFYMTVYNDSDAAVSVSARVVGDGVTTSIDIVPTATPMVNPFATVIPLGKGVSGRIAFVDAAGGNLYTMNGDGTNLHRVSFGLDPQWNHAGNKIALARQGPIPGIFTINADGSNEQILYGTNQPRSPDWSPDDSHIVFSYLTSVGGGGQICFKFRGHKFCFTKPPTNLWRLAEVNSTGGGYADVRATNDAFTPTWNADGVTIAFNDLTIGIMQMSINNDYVPFPFVGDLRITSPVYNPLKLMSPQYSPDGKQIVYMVYQQPAWQIAVANADGSNQHLLTRLDPLDFVHPDSVAPVWSPDGSQILFLSNRNGKWEFFTTRPDGSHQLQVLKNVSDETDLNYSFQSDRILSWTK